MKKLYPAVLLFLLFQELTFSQNYSPVASSGYNLDAVAENTTSIATTGGAIDGSDFVLYSAAYGALFNTVGGLPNSGSISSPGYSFQMQPYTQNNLLYVLSSQTAVLSINTPTVFASVSLLGFATEGTGSMNVTLTFTDTSTQSFNNLTLDDWFGGSTSVISGFGRVSRTSGAIANPAGQPKMFHTNLHLACTNRSKALQSITINNTSGNARICIVAVAGSDAPVYTPTSSPASCANGTNGTASLQIVNALPPNTFTWNSAPTQHSGQANNLTAGVYSFTVNDGAGCSFSSTVSVGVSLTNLPPLQVGTSGTLVCPGTPVTLSTFGAVSYTWSNGLNSPVTSVTPTNNTTYSVFGTNAANCLVSGGVVISTHTVQPVTVSPLPNAVCLSAPALSLSATPGGGTFTGTGLQNGVFSPSLAGAGTFTLAYALSDANNCISSQSLSIIVHALPAIVFSLTPAEFCVNSPTILLGALPAGGTFSGNGVNGNVFSPSQHAAGSSSITYVYTDANTCTDSAKAGLIVHPLPVISFTSPVTTICIKAASITLQAGPAGGQFTGNGVVGASFSPSVAGLGTHVISYAYTHTLTNCSNSQSHSITVSACTGLIETATAATLYIYPNPAPSGFVIHASAEGFITVLNPLGQVVIQQQVGPNSQLMIQSETLSEGLYSVVFQNTDNRSVYKVLVTR